jgi:hypothetical protein
MDMFTLVAFVVYGYGMYQLGRYTIRSLLDDKVVNAIVAKASVPIGVIEHIEGHYYVYEKDTTNFLGQAATIEELPQKLMEKKIGLALLMYPEQSSEVYWCVNGKLKSNL